MGAYIINAFSSSEEQTSNSHNTASIVSYWVVILAIYPPILVSDKCPCNSISPTPSSMALHEHAGLLAGAHGVGEGAQGIGTWSAREADPDPEKKAPRSHP